MRGLWKDRSGFMSVYVVMWMAVLIPLFLFITIDLTHYVQERGHLKAVTDNASASAITQIKEELVGEGILEIDEVKAKEVAEKIIKNDLNLNDDFTPKANSILKERPTLAIQVVNVVTSAGVDVETPAGTVTVYKPSVIIYAKYPVKGLFYFNTSVEMQKVGVSQVAFRNENK